MKCDNNNSGHRITVPDQLGQIECTDAMTAAAILMRL